ncbi:3-oxoacyl-[acyl-carrier protein] reductase [Liquorilactobacillus sucicola DSM 21376 = JCM 15457]|nr:3-oxoacyl-[acyl-carrier protein] reductase [Liquorilactobacillus sucicola DSM 21376 = JCM 15457]
MIELTILRFQIFKKWEVNTRGFYLTGKHYARFLKAKGKKGKIIVDS